MSDPSFESIYNKTLRFLSFRPRSEKEIIDYLTKKDVSSLNIDKILNKLREYKFIDDLEFARWFIENRRKGKRLVLMELSHKGIPPEIIEEVTSTLDLVKKDTDLLERLIEKKWKTYQGKKNPYEKMMSFLLRRGLDYETAKKALKKRLLVDEKSEE